MSACDPCLRRAHLAGFLAPRITAELGERARRPPYVLGLSEEELIRAVCGTGPRAQDALAFLERFDPGPARLALGEAGVSAACRHSTTYPRSLLDLDDPPPVMFVAGSLDVLSSLADRRVVTIVGARRASAHGLEVARSMGRALAAAGVVVVSGLALGIDAAAHEGACDGPGAPPVAVIARGPERAYPRRNRGLYACIAECGCVVSELPPGTPVFRWAFPARNRIMAALGRCTVVVEAAERSGTLITVEFATQMGRDVAAVPGRVTARTAAGSNALLRDGAHVALGSEDVLRLLGASGPGEPDTETGSLMIDDPALERVLDALGAADSLEELRELTGLEASALRGALGRLELIGAVRRSGAGGWVRALP